MTGNVKELLQATETTDLKIVSVKLPEKVASACRTIRLETGKTNTEVYTALLMEGIEKYKAATGRAKNGRGRRGRPKGSKNKPKE